MHRHDSGEIGGQELDYTLSEQARKVDYICYISDLSKLGSHYPDGDITISLQEILTSMISAEQSKLAKTPRQSNGCLHASTGPAG
jgi:CDP-paratose 2-epimerase